GLLPLFREGEMTMAGDHHHSPITTWLGLINTWPLGSWGRLKRSPGKRQQTGASRLGSLCGGGHPPGCRSYYDFAPTACLEHCAMKKGGAKKGARRGDWPLGAMQGQVFLAGVQLEFVP